MLASDWEQKSIFEPKSETNIRMICGTDLSRVASQGLSHPFLKTLATIFPDPTDHSWVSKDNSKVKFSFKRWFAFRVAAINALEF